MLHVHTLNQGQKFRCEMKSEMNSILHNYTVTVLHFTKKKNPSTFGLMNDHQHIFFFKPFTYSWFY